MSRQAADGVLLQPSICRERSDGLRWLARCLFPQARSKSQYHTRVSVDPGTNPGEARHAWHMRVHAWDALVVWVWEDNKIGLHRSEGQESKQSTVFLFHPFVINSEMRDQVDLALSVSSCIVRRGNHEHFQQNLVYNKVA